MKVLVSLLFIVALALVAQADFNEAVQQLARFQDLQTGAFMSNQNSAPTLEATTDALFLSSLYGLNSKINAFKAEEFLQSLRTKENGYSSTAGAPATLEATFNAVVAYLHLGKEVPQNSAVVDFVLSLVDAQNLFANNLGGRGNIKSTYQAIATLKALNAIESLPSPTKNALTATLTNAHSNGKYFSFKNVPVLQSNFYGVYIWEALNEDVLNANENANFVLSQQSPSGGFFADEQRTTQSYESAAQAMATLDILGDYATPFVGQINENGLAAFCRVVPADLAETAAAHKAIAHSNMFSENFKFVVEYGGADTRGNPVLQGTQLRPEIVVRSFNGPSHSNLNVVVKYAISGENSKVVRLAWDDENQKYVAPQGIDTSNKLGRIDFDYEMTLNVFGVGSIQFSQKAEKNIGHRVSVIPTATHKVTGASIKEGEAVSANTEFEFDVKLANKTHSNIKSGDFAVTFDILDSAYATIYSEVVPAQFNEDAFQFSFTLDQLNIPAGALTFVVSVKGQGDKLYANEIVSYVVSVPMVAYDIELNQQEFSLNEEFSVSFIPATYPELREPLALVEPHPSSQQPRRFFLDISTTSGVVVNSIPGQFSNGRYSFEQIIPANYGSLGSFVISFRYESAAGSIELDNFDGDEVSEEPLTFSVKADLVGTVLAQPDSANFFYGNDISYRFKVVDKVTNLPVALSQTGGVFLNVNSFDKRKGKYFLSTKLAATQDGDELVINWKVNPNAASGDGNLVLVAEGPSGASVPLLVDGKEFKTNINIGGEIKEDVKMFSTDDFYSSQTAFIVEFELSCNDVVLRDVKLRAVIFYEGEEIGSAPVGVSGDKYLASWNSLHIEAESGTYVVRFYREADQQRAAENEDWRQKQLRDKQREAELSGEAFDEAKFLDSLESVDVEPLFSVTIPHSQVTRGGLPFGTEWLIFIPAAIGFLFFDRIKLQYRNGMRK